MNDISKILVIQTAYPGDAILTLPLIQKLKKKYSDVLIDILCIDTTREIFSASPYVNFVHVLDKHNKHKSILSLLKFIKYLKKENYIAIYSPHRSFRSGLITLLLGVKESTGFSNSSFKFAFKNAVEYDYSAHEVKRNLSLVRNDLGEKNWKILPEIEIPDRTKQKISDYLNGMKIKDGFIAIAPGSIWNTKKYPEKYFSELAKKLIDGHHKIVLIGGKSDKALGDSIRSNNELNIINTCGEFSFIESIEMLKHCRLLICNDSAPTHLAMCADIPVLTIYCSTSPIFGFYPYNGKSKSLSYDELSCKPCGIHGYNECPIGTFECAHNLKIDFIFSEIETMLD